MTRTETSKLVAALLGAYPQAQFGPASSAVYERMLADLEYEAAVAAVERLMATSKWLPTIAEIRQTAADLAHGPRRLGAEAWGEVGEAVRRFGAYSPAPEFADPLVAECVRLFGWRELCLGTNEVADRARFIELYDGLEERRRADEVAGRALPPRRLAGPVAGAVRALAASTIRRAP